MDIPMRPVSGSKSEKQPGREGSILRHGNGQRPVANAGTHENIPDQECSRACPYCERYSTTVEKRRQNTAYVKEERNWVTCCLKCFKEIQEHWTNMWSDYYSNVM